MRFLELSLTAFGHFTDRRLHFPPPPTGGGLHLIHGRNEAGKSTTLAALSDLLFGFEPRSVWNFLHNYPSLSVGARIDDGAGNALTFTRRKRDKNALLDAEGAPLDPAALEPFLGALDRRMFNEMFGLGHVRLREGGRELLAGGGDVGSSLFDAGSGLKGVRQALEGLRQEAETYFLPQGKKRRLNGIRTDFQSAREQKKTASLSRNAWQRLDRERCEQEQELARLTGALAENNRERTRLERIRRTGAALARYGFLIRALAAMPETPELAEEAPRERREVLAAIQQAETAITRKEKEIASLTERLDGLPLPEEILAREALIEALNGECGALRKSLTDLPRRQRERDGIRDRIASLWQEGGFPVRPPEGLHALPPRPLVARLRALIKQDHDLRLRLGQSRKNLQALQREVARRHAMLEEIPATPDPGPLAALLGEITERGPLEAQLAETGELIHGLEREIDHERQALPLWGGATEALLDLPTPSEEQVGRFAEEAKGLSQSLEAARQAADDARDALERVGAEMAALAAAGEIPTAEALHAARRHRDRGWQWIRRVHIDRTVAAEAADAGADRDFAPGHPLAEAFAASIAAADRLADSRLLDAQRVARFNALESEEQRERIRLAKALKQLRTLTRQRQRLDARWLEVWCGSGIPPLEPVAMLTWPRQRLKILERLAVLDQTRRRWNSLAEEITAYRARLADHLAGLNPPPAARTTLAAELRQAGSLLEAWRSVHGQRADLTRRLAELDEKRKEGFQEEEAIAKEKTAWLSYWYDALRALNQPTDTTPEAVEAMLELLEAVRGELKVQEELDGRIRAMEADHRDFFRRVEDLPPELESAPAADPLAVVAALHGRLRDGKDRQLRRQEWTGQQQNLMGERQALQDQLAQQRRRLTGLEKIYGCAIPEEMEAVERRARQRDDHRREFQEVEKRLLELGDGREIAALTREAEQEESDTLPGRIDALVTENERLAAEQSRVAVALAEVRSQLADMAGGEAAAEAAQEMAEALSRLRQGAEAHVTLHLAAALLQGAIDRYRERTQAPALGRAARLFRELTLGAFSGVESDVNDKGETVLLGVRDGGGRVPVEAMSDGTRDQLFLALRLALIELHIEHNRPVPFVADDLFVHFDDRRSLAAFRVLAALSQKTQVLFFTHHAHLIDLAREALGPDGNGLSIQEL